MPWASRRPLIVGTGIAGLYVALRSHEVGLRPTLVTKALLEESNTRYAQGGIAAAIGEGDSPALHLRDTLAAGAGLVDPVAARILVEEAPRRIADLVRFGVPFDTVEGRIALGREAAHSRERIVHAGGDATGLALETTLRKDVLEAGIEVRERTALRGIRCRPGAPPHAILEGEGGGSVEEVEAPTIVLATGGAGSLYRESSNPEVARGEGVAIAARAGALLEDLEFVQFHPTVFFREGAPRYLLTEALRGEGAVLRNELGERFMLRYHPDAELAPRDIVSRAIHTEMERTQTPWVYLDATAIPRDRLYARFPTICRFLSGYALDPSRDQIPITPAAHFSVGGVATDPEGRTTCPGLLACGEVAATGVHGANRLASNSLLEGVVFGERVVRQLLHPSAGGPPLPNRLRELPRPRGRGAPGPPGRLTELRALLWRDVGIVRSGPGLRRAVRQLEAWGREVEPPEGELPSLLADAILTARLIAVAALQREESRGAHYRTDFPKPREAWRERIGIRLGTASSASGTARRRPRRGHPRANR